jgi:hypothetical protein
MILSLNRTAHVVRNFDMTEFGFRRPHGGTGFHRNNMSHCLKNVSVRNARLVTPKAFALSNRPNRRPRSPSSNHNVKEPSLGAKFHHARDATPPARPRPGGRRGRGIYAGGSRVSNGKFAEISLFFPHLWMVAPYGSGSNADAICSGNFSSIRLPPVRSAKPQRLPGRFSLRRSRLAHRGTKRARR